jgi:hypothetical protein
MKDSKPTMKNAILAQCHECMGHYQDGKVDCQQVKCSLYTWMPFRKLEPDHTWVRVHPKRQGKVFFRDIDTSNMKCHFKPKTDSEE